MGKIKPPSFIDYTYTTWHFWIIVALWSLWIGSFSSVGEFITSLIGTAIVLSLFYLFSYLLTRSAFKKLNKV